MFDHWLRTSSILAPSELPLLNADEYLGGLGDLTGEIGRVAVAAATKRDLATVDNAYSTCLAVLDLFLSLNLPPKVARKFDALNGTVKKLEAILYDLALASRSKRPLPDDIGTKGSDDAVKRSRNNNNDDDDDIMLP